MWIVDYVKDRFFRVSTVSADAQKAAAIVADLLKTFQEANIKPGDTLNILIDRDVLDYAIEAFYDPLITQNYIIEQSENDPTEFLVQTRELL